MCGLIYGRTKKDLQPINKAILKQYYNQKYRGVKGFGIYDGQYQHIIKETTEPKILKWLKEHKSTEILFHHRLPTSTENTKLGAHPFSTKDFFENREYILIHNGVIRNADKLAAEHATRGITYWSSHADGSYNDSESLLWDIALFLEGEQELPKAAGSIAFILIKKVDGKQSLLYYYHNSGNPLYIRDTNRHFMLNSFDNSKEAKAVPENKLFAYDYSLETTVDYPLTMDTYVYNPAPRGWNWENEHRQSEFEFNNEEQHEGGLDDGNLFESIQNGVAQQDDEVQKQYDKLSDFDEFSSDIKSKCLDFLSDAEGYYNLAVGLMQERLISLDDEAYTLETWYEKEVLRAACGVLLADPFWNKKDTETRHPIFKGMDADKSTPRIALPATVELQVNTTPTTDEKMAKGPQIFLPAGTSRLPNEKRASLVAEVLAERSSEIKSQLDRNFKAHTVHIIEPTPALIRAIPRMT